MRRLAPAMLLALTVALIALASLAVMRVSAAAPAPDLGLDTPALFVAVPGDPAAIPTPRVGSLTLAQSNGVRVADRDGDAARPIGSVAKTMTALVVLDRHPLRAHELGPELTMTAVDAELYLQAVREQGSAVPVRAGEQWHERDLLLALMLPSANNVADSLALWVSGDRGAFVELLNERAAAMGLSRTHFDDPSGFSAATVSSTRDLVALGTAALRNPVLADIVSTRGAVLPDGVRTENLDVLLSEEPGWLGIKTGWTPSAGGCLLFAVQRSFARETPPVVVVGAVVAQPADASYDAAHPELGGAVRAAQQAASAFFDGEVAVHTADIAPTITGSVVSAWGPRSDVLAVPVRDDVVVLRRGESLAVTATLMQLSLPAAGGATVGRLTGVARSGARLSWTLRIARSVGGPSAWWKLTHD